MLSYLIMAIAITAAVCVILNQYWNIKALKKEKEVLIKNRVAQQKLIFELSNSEAITRQELDIMKRGWWPASKINSTPWSKFAYIDGGKEWVIPYEVKYINNVGVVFKGSTGFVEWSNLKVFVGKIK